MILPNPLNITVVILAKNEADVIEKSIHSASFASDILVVDSGSSDSTCEIAKRFGARVVYHEWPGDFSAQRNFADSCALFEWILHLDADETFKPETALELNDFFTKGLNEKYLSGRFPRREIVFGKWLKHGGWYPQYKLRLYKKNSGKWVGKVHEHFENTGEILTFSSPIMHDSYKDVHTFIDKFNKYSTLDSEAEYAGKRRFSLLKLIFQPIERFWGRYIIHKGCLDGFHGFAVASLISLNYFFRYLKLWEKYYFEEKRIKVTKG